MMRAFASFGELVPSIVFVVFVLSYLVLKVLFIYSKSSEKKSFKAAVISAFCAVILLFFSSCELGSAKIANILRYAFRRTWLCFLRLCFYRAAF